jgi:hypothetical protein
MEQFPPLMASLRERREFELDMYSQGIERSLLFVPDADLLAMLSELAANFAIGLRVVHSPLVDPPP